MGSERMLRDAADGRTLVWCLAMPAVTLTMYGVPRLIPFLFPVACYLSMAAGLIAHNHHHRATFRQRWLNEVLSVWLSVFQGYPAFSWLPTHNRNHHRYVNREGDATITWRNSRKHTAWTAGIALFTVKLGPLVRAYVSSLRDGSPARYRWICVQYIVWAAWPVGLLAGAAAVYGLWEGTKVWLLATGLPLFFAPWSIASLSYIQHVHTDPWSEYNHSRNFTGALFNWLTFNLGYHTVHHERPSAHWSTLPSAHARIEHLLHPELRVENFLVWCLRSYVLAPLSPHFGTQQIGRAPDAPPPSVS
jgi:beta-carotene hydroxylase